MGSMHPGQTRPSKLMISFLLVVTVSFASSFSLLVFSRQIVSGREAVVPSVLVQGSPEDVGSAARLDYYQQVLDQLQHHPAIRDRTKHLPLYVNRGKKSSDPVEWLQMRNAVEYALALLQVKVVFVDEAQHLLAPDPVRKPTVHLDWLKTLANRTNVLHVLVGNFDLYEYCHLSGQVVRRMRDQQFPRYHLDTQKECEEFVGALKSLLEHVPLTVDVGAMLSRWRWFGEWSVGCVGVLGDWIVDTVDALWRKGETVLTIEALTKHALQPDQRARLEMEARTGENRVARAKAQSELELQRLLSTPASDGKPLQTTPSVPSPSAWIETKETGSSEPRAATRWGKAYTPRRLKSVLDQARCCWIWTSTVSPNQQSFMYNAFVGAYEKDRSKRIRLSVLPMTNCVVGAPIQAHDGSRTGLSGK
jgi:hypothetical protein